MARKGSFLSTKKKKGGGGGGGGVSVVFRLCPSMSVHGFGVYMSNETQRNATSHVLALCDHQLFFFYFCVCFFPPSFCVLFFLLLFCAFFFSPPFSSPSTSLGMFVVCKGCSQWRGKHLKFWGFLFVFWGFFLLGQGNTNFC